MRWRTPGQPLLLLGWLGALLFPGCPAPTSLPVELRVGVHAVRLTVPTGWQHQDHGREQRFERGLAQITLTDLGPATREGFVREVRRSRRLALRNQPEDARTRIQALEPRRVFRDRDRWEAVEPAWRLLAGGRRHEIVEAEELEAAYTEVLVQLAALPGSDLESLVRRALDELGHDTLRDIAWQRAAAVSGRPALSLETWDRLTHAGRRRHLFVLNEGNLLCLRMQLGDFAILEPAFESLFVNLRLVGQPSGGA